MIIKSGSNGNVANVNSNNELLCKSTIKFELTQATGEQRVFSITTGFIALTTTGSFSGILYLKNIESFDMEFYRIILGCQVACEWKFIKNPSLGTLISGGSAISAINMKFNSGAVIAPTLLKGVDAQTVTDGTEIFHIIQVAGYTLIEPEGAIRIPANSSIAFSCKPASAGDVSFSALIEREEDE